METPREVIARGVAEMKTKGHVAARV